MQKKLREPLIRTNGHPTSGRGQFSNKFLNNFENFLNDFRDKCLKSDDKHDPAS